jgi:hypothetical protein
MEKTVYIMTNKKMFLGTIKCDFAKWYKANKKN